MSARGLFPDPLLLVMAHPDDAEILCFGTIARHLAAGGKAHLLVICGGDGGVAVRDAERAPSPDALSQTRRNESLDAFRGLDLSIEFEGRRDGAIVVDRDLISLVERVMLRVEPRTVITHAIDHSGADHQDHTAIGRATTNAVRRSRSVTQLLYPEPEALGASFTPTCFIEIGDHFDAKMAALACHRSQAGRTYLTREFHRQRGLSNALRVGPGHFEAGRVFEAFQIAKVVL